MVWSDDIVSAAHSEAGRVISPGPLLRRGGKSDLFYVRVVLVNEHKQAH